MNELQVKKIIDKADNYLYKADALVTDILIEVQKHTDTELFIQHTPNDGWCFSFIYIDEFGNSFDNLAPITRVFNLLNEKKFLSNEDLDSVSV